MMVTGTTKVHLSASSGQFEGLTLVSPSLLSAGNLTGFDECCLNV
jgi:hypothetical protein